MIICGTVNDPRAPEMHQGAFITVDTKSRTADYSFPTSPNARLALKPGGARKVAQGKSQFGMISNEYATQNCISLLQFCRGIQGFSQFDLIDPESITYELTSDEKTWLLTGCTIDSAWKTALELK